MPAVFCTYHPETQTQWRITGREQRVAAHWAHGCFRNFRCCIWGFATFWSQLKTQKNKAALNWLPSDQQKHLCTHGFRYSFHSLIFFHLPAVEKIFQCFGLRSIGQRKIIACIIVVGPQQTSGRTCANKSTHVAERYRGTPVFLNLDLISGMKYVYLLKRTVWWKSFGRYLDYSRSAYIHIMGENSLFTLCSVTVG